MNTFHGRIQKIIMINCGSLDIRDIVCTAKETDTGDITACRIRWQEAGWKHTAKYGWLCPTCAKLHTNYWARKRKKNKASNHVR